MVMLKQVVIFLVISTLNTDIDDITVCPLVDTNSNVPQVRAGVHTETPIHPAKK